MQRSICFFRGSEHGDNWWSHVIWDHDLRRSARLTLYNVPGLDTIELKLKSSNVSRIGIDGPSGLVAALNAGLRQ